jgi:pimeloyl-ACP methyl ester carboxylesterase
MSEDSIAAFRASEARLLARHGLNGTEQFVALKEPALRARLISAGKGPPVLYVIGGGGFGTLWAPLAGALDGRRHLMPDRPGFVLTPWIDLRGADFRSHAVSFLSSLLDGLGIDSVDIVANSMGALWSLWLALDAPQRVRRLALLGAPAFTCGGSAPLPMRLLGRPQIGRLMMALEPPSPKQVRTLWSRMGVDPGRLDDTVLDAMLAAEKVPTYAPAWRALLGRTLTLSAVRPDCVLPAEALTKIRCPTLIVWGKTDPFGSVAMGEQIANAIAGARLVVANGGHLPWLDDGATCARALAEFLGATSLSEGTGSAIGAPAARGSSLRGTPDSQR